MNGEEERLDALERRIHQLERRLSGLEAIADAASGPVTAAPAPSPTSAPVPPPALAVAGPPPPAPAGRRCAVVNHDMGNLAPARPGPARLGPTRVWGDGTALARLDRAVGSGRPARAARLVDEPGAGRRGPAGLGGRRAPGTAVAPRPGGAIRGPCPRLGWRPCARRGRGLLLQHGLQPRLDQRADAGPDRPRSRHRGVNGRRRDARAAQPAHGQRAERGRTRRRVHRAVRRDPAVRPRRPGGWPRRARS